MIISSDCKLSFHEAHVSLKCNSPFYKAYVSQVEVINEIIDKSIKDSAEKMGDSVSAIYSIKSKTSKPCL